MQKSRARPARAIITIAATVAASLAAASVVASDTRPVRGIEQQLIDLERRSWVAWRDHDAAFFERFLSEDHIEMQGTGPASRRAVIATVRAGCQVAHYDLDQFSVHLLDNHTAIVTYRADQDTTCGAARVPTPVWATSLFQKRGGRWVNVLYVHSPAPPVR